MSHKWHSVLITSVIIACIEGFNLDVNHTIVYEYPNKDVRRSSYFGFSLLLYSGSSGGMPWIQIGAPRGNDQTLYWGVEEPGLVFRCPIRLPCSNVVLENGGSGFVRYVLVRGRHVKYTDKKETAWIGGAMDIDEKTGRVVVCGHRWRDDHTKTEVFEYMTGVCYLSTLQQNINGYRNADKLLPFVDPVQYFTPRGANLHYLLNYGMAQAGSSVHFPKSKEQEILIGAPGAANWKGRTALYQNNHSLTPEVFNVRELEIADYSLFGYQVNSGKFKKRDSVYYVTGNPKGAKHMGIVYIYVQNGKDNVKKITSVEGTKPGEYFGSSLAVADVNCDHVDDLIVGAPLYSIENDEGRIYTFIANFKSTVFNSPTTITGEHVGGRFGTTVTSLGDLDNDGCEDIAVGAPYENNHSGAVYIYSGSEQGLILTQKISASDIVVNPPLKGFGLGISRAADIDYNKYPDVAVGAFLSEHVVLFRALPVVTLNTRVNSRVKKLKKDAKSFTITVCLSYSGISVPLVLTVSRKIILDEMYLRAHFKNKESTMISNITISSKQHCNDIEVFLLKTAIEDNTSGPITIKASQELVNSARTKTVFIVGNKTSAEAQDGFQNNIAVVNERHSVKSAVLNIEFDPECGENNVCEAILNLNCTLLGVTKEGYILGSNAKLQLEINLTNSGGPAYSTNVDISIPSPIELSLGHENCEESFTSSGTLLHCNLGHPLRNGTLKNLTLNFNTQGVKPGSKNLTFNISATTSSKDKNANINTKQLQLNFIIDADVIIAGRSDELVYYYNKDNKTVFRHKYEVLKTGSSPIDVVEIELNIPFKLKGKNGNFTFLNIYSPMGYLNAEQPLVCSPVQDFEYYIEENLVKEEDINVVQRSKREVNSAVPQPADNQTLFLNCSSSAVECVKIKCSAGPFESGSQTSASVELKLSLNVTTLVPVMGKKDVIYFSTDGAVSIKEPEILNTTKRFHYKIVSTKFENTTYVESITKKVATWIVALAIIAGILIFMFVVIGLMKAGFFERKKKEELKSLMAIYATNVFMAGAVQNQYQTVEDGDADDIDDGHDKKTQEPEE